MKMRIAALVLAFAAALPLAASAQQLSAVLRGSNEVPATSSSALGIASVDIQGSVVTYVILANDLGSVTAAHIHRGAAGVAGPPVVTFNPPLFGSVTVADQALLGEILANPSNFYVNVHTSQFPDGEIRGQLSHEVAADPGETVSYLPIAGRVAGGAGTFFVTDVRIVNNGAGPAEVKLEFFPLSQGGVAAPSATATVTVEAHEQAVLDDAANSLLHVEGLGALRITADEPVVTFARIINDQRPNAKGTAGFAFASRSIGEAETAGILPFLSASPDFRTNLGYFNPQATPATVTFTARDSATGAILGSNTITVGGWGGIPPLAAFAVISSVPEAARAQDDFYVTWSSSAPMLVWASVTDNVTGDGVFVQ